MTTSSLKTYINELINNTSLANAADETDNADLFPGTLVFKLIEHGLLKQSFPTNIGGLGDSYQHFLANIQLISTQFAALASIISTQVSLGIWPIYNFGTLLQRQTYLSSMLDGTLWAAFAYNETNTDSSLNDIKTTATETADGWVITGEKDMIANATIADLFLVVAQVKLQNGKQSYGIFLVPKNSQGLSVGPALKKIGIRALPVATISLDNVTLSKKSLLGDELNAENQVSLIVNHIRLAIAAKSLGIAKGAFQIAVNYATQERKFGLQLISSQDIQKELAEVGTSIDATQAYFNQVVQLRVDETVGIAKLKLLASNTALKTTETLIQITGAYGSKHNAHIERYARDAKAATLYGGSASSQRKIIIEPWLNN